MVMRTWLVVVPALLVGGLALGQADWLEIAGVGSAREVWEALQSGADLEARDERGWTPLMRAIAWNRNPGVLQALLAAGASVDARDNVRLQGTDAYERLRDASSD